MLKFALSIHIGTKLFAPVSRQIQLIILGWTWGGLKQENI